MSKCRKKSEFDISRFVKMLDELKADGINQNDFASVIGVTDGLVSNLKAGRNALTISIAKKIERAFPNYRAAWLLGLDEMTASKVDALNSKIDALKVLNPMVSVLSPERRDALLEYVQDFIEFELRKKRG